MSNNVTPPTLSLSYFICIFLRLFFQFLLTQIRTTQAFRITDGWAIRLCKHPSSTLAQEIQVFEQHKKLTPVQSSLQNENKHCNPFASLIIFSPHTHGFTGIRIREDTVYTFFYPSNSSDDSEVNFGTSLHLLHLPCWYLIMIKCTPQKVIKAIKKQHLQCTLFSLSLIKKGEEYAESSDA